MGKTRVIDRFLEYTNYKRISNYRAEKDLEWGNGAIGKYKNDEQRDISHKLITQILRHYIDINEEWLLNGEGAMLKTQPVQEKPTEKPQQSLPLIPLRAAAGFLSGFDEEGVKLSECEQYVVPLFSNISADFLIQINGDSMSPKFQNGDIVACRKVSEPQFLQWGHIYVLDTTGGIIMKEINRAPEEGSIICHSLNERYTDFTIPLATVRHIAMVVGVISSLG
ncbi:MAG: helix-turn-helix transcriptional regulator [Bacteroidales bacterium]|nr:helix-turn-helix transcriptional regulator [Bacteroidales bacterium]